MSTPVAVTHSCALLHDGLRQSLLKGGFRPVRVSTTLSKELESYLRSLNSVVWLVGVESCGRNTYDLIERVAATTPGVKPVILAISQTPNDILGALKAGARGVFYQDIPGERLVNALKSIALGDIVVHRCQIALGQTQSNTALEGNGGVLENNCATYQTRLSDSPASHMLREVAMETSRESHGDTPSLSRRETLILRMLMEGASNKTIALKLVITESNVKVRMKALFRKLRFKNRTQAAIWARDHII